MDIRDEIETYLVTYAVAPSRFGRLVCGDPRLVFDVRGGRQVGEVLEKRIRNHLASGTKGDHLASIATKIKRSCAQVAIYG